MGLVRKEIIGSSIFERGKESTVDYLVSEWVGFLVPLFVVYTHSILSFTLHCALSFLSASQHIHTYGNKKLHYYYYCFYRLVSALIAHIFDETCMSFVLHDTSQESVIKTFDS